MANPQAYHREQMTSHALPLSDARTRASNLEIGKAGFLSTISWRHREWVGLPVKCNNCSLLPLRCMTHVLRKQLIVMKINLQFERF